MACQLIPGPVWQKDRLRENYKAIRARRRSLLREAIRLGNILKY